MSLRGSLETILVVDDEPMIVSVVSEILEGANYFVLCAHSGDEAQKIAAVHTGPIHLLFQMSRCRESQGRTSARS